MFCSLVCGPKGEVALSCFCHYQGGNVLRFRHRIFYLQSAKRSSILLFYTFWEPFFLVYMERLGFLNMRMDTYENKKSGGVYKRLRFFAGTPRAIGWY